MMILKDDFENIGRQKIKRGQKDTAEVSHITEASSSCTSQNPVALQRLFS